MPCAFVYLNNLLHYGYIQLNEGHTLSWCKKVKIENGRWG